MMSRAIFILVTLFWVAMNLLLWRAEYGSAKGGTTVSADMVWEKILTAPDDSSLNVIYQGKRVGFCRWRTGVGDAWSQVSDENIPSGLPGKDRGYNLRVEGSVILEEAANRIRFEADLQLGRKRELRQMKTRLAVRPAVWDVTCVASNQNVELSIDNESGSWRRHFQISDLQNPGSIIAQVFEPVAGDWLTGVAGPLSALQYLSPDASNFTWDAATDWTQIGHTPIQVYRLHTRIMQRFDVNILVSRAGEILRIELPDSIVLINDQLHSL